jgi:hypothetical protein
MRVLWLPTVLRAAGLTVHEVAGWKTRGADSFGPVRGITCHHTAGSRTSSDAGEIGVLVNGRVGLSGPIAQLYLSRSGDWHVVASGHCNHNLVGWAGPNEGYGNDSLLGIEAQHSGDGEPWTARQYDSYVRGVAALVRHEASGWAVTVGRVAGHKEHQPGAKSDPSFDMTAFRARVRSEIDSWEDDDMPTVKEIWQTDGIIEAPANAPSAKDNPHWAPASFLRDSSQLARTNNALLLQIAAKLGTDLVDEQQIISGVLAGLDPAAIAAAIPPELARQVADELAARLAS